MTTYVQCRYLRRSGEQCTGEVADENGEILLCQKHLARAIELVKARLAEAKKAGITPATTTTKEATR